MRSPDLYAMLGVAEDASAEEIKRAYRRLARQYHPDSTGGDKAKEKKFKEVSTAYDVLGDPRRRAEYDAMKSGGFGGFGGNGFGGAGGPGGVSGFGGLGDLFEQMFGGGGRAAEVRYEFFGGEPRVRTRASRRSASRAARATKPRKKTLRLPDGTRARLDGNDVYADLHIDIAQAILGAVVEVATLGGKTKLKVPPGTSSGVKLRLRGKGRSGGNHYAVVQIDVPSGLDRKGEKALAELMKHVREGVERETGETTHD